MSLDASIKPPRTHFKCRFHDQDLRCISKVYTRTKNIMVKNTRPRERLQVRRLV